MILEEQEPVPHVGGFYGETVRTLLINTPVVLFFVSAEFTTWLSQKRPHQPDPTNGFVQLNEFRGGKVYSTPAEALISQWLSNLFWIVLAASVVLLWLRTYRRPGTPVFRPSEEGVPHPAEFVTILIVIVGIIYGIVVR